MVFLEISTPAPHMVHAVLMSVYSSACIAANVLASVECSGMCYLENVAHLLHFEPLHSACISVCVCTTTIPIGMDRYVHKLVFVWVFVSTCRSENRWP